MIQSFLGVRERFTGASAVAAFDEGLSVHIVSRDGLGAVHFSIVSEPLSLYVDSNFADSHPDRDDISHLVLAVSPLTSKDALFSDRSAETIDLDKEGLFTVGDLNIALPVVLRVLSFVSR